LRNGDEPEGLLSAVEAHYYRRLTLSAVLRRVFGNECDRIIRISPADTHVATAQPRRKHGYEPTREAAMAAFAKSWRRE